MRNVLALRGDPPGDPLGEWQAHPEGLDYADELVRLVKRARRLLRRGGGVPGEAPALARPRARTRAHFVAKCRAGADFAITQMFFGADDYFRLRDRVAALGCDMPIIPGIMPVTNVRSIERFGAAVRRGVPGRAGRRLHAVEDDPAAVRAVGVEARDRAVRAAARRGRARPALLHAQPVDGDPGGLRGARARRPPGPHLR